VAILGKVLPREFALPGVRQMPSTRREFIAPGIFAVAAGTTRRPFPFGFGRQLPACPAGIRLDVGVGHVHHRMILATVQRTARPLRMSPVGARHELPPLVHIAQIHALCGRHEHDRRSHQHFRQRTRIVGGVGCDLAERDVPGGLDEAPELRIGDWRCIHPEAIHPDRVRGRFFGIVVIGTHAKGPVGNPDHVGKRR
jgi:hypothetical protein